MDLYLKDPAAVVALLCERLRRERIFLGLTQREVARRAGVGVNTVSNLEMGRSVGLETFVRITMVLRRLDELEALFNPKLTTVSDVLGYEAGVSRQRVRRKGRHG